MTPHGYAEDYGYRTTQPLHHYRPRSPVSIEDSESSRSLNAVPQAWRSEKVSDRVVALVKEELNEDVDDVLKQNLKTYLRKFREQERQLKNIEKTVVKQGDRVVAAIREGAHDRVHDPELRAIWKEMGWKLGVPAFEFVSTLHDYHAAEHNIAEKVEHFSRMLTTESSQEHQTLALRRAFNEAKKRAADTWALKYINITNLQPLVEIFDGDMSGYVSVWEANEILSLRPEGWRSVD
ncbi:hypothetical protein K435DRAFT_697508 [Dendrothele bispora CBS 962.96]|uniref:EF-hand domain-containing protein n=1 Tax=Dendrothele bispora (strain CBS 962.96) TaxID=1314807 RepID=A0A4S8KUY2_DENBC|nr:hypothetical protein K435DRAFT_697508 [Dendrothele bispora CBS 962.96]